MLKKMIGGYAAVMALSGLSGCCSFWEKHCAQPSYAQPVCCQPCAPACPSGMPMAMREPSRLKSGRPPNGATDGGTVLTTRRARTFQIRIGAFG